MEELCLLNFLNHKVHSVWLSCAQGVEDGDLLLSMDGESAGGAGMELAALVGSLGGDTSWGVSSAQG